MWQLAGTRVAGLTWGISHEHSTRKTPQLAWRKLIGPKRCRPHPSTARLAWRKLIGPERCRSHPSTARGSRCHCIVARFSIVLLRHDGGHVFPQTVGFLFRVLPRLLILPAMPADADENEADAALVLSFTLLMSRALNPLVKPPKKLFDFPAPPSPVDESGPTPLPSCACEWRGTHLVKT